MTLKAKTWGGTRRTLWYHFTISIRLKLLWYSPSCRNCTRCVFVRTHGVSWLVYFAFFVLFLLLCRTRLCLSLLRKQPGLWCRIIWRSRPRRVIRRHPVLLRPERRVRQLVRKWRRTKLRRKLRPRSSTAETTIWKKCTSMYGVFRSASRRESGTIFHREQRCRDCEKCVLIVRVFPFQISATHYCWNSKLRLRMSGESHYQQGQWHQQYGRCGGKNGGFYAI